MSFLVGPALSEEIYKLAASGDVDCAVAFWGTGAERMFGDLQDRNVRIICNLRMGGTNPTVIQALRANRQVQVHHSDFLHAKVYLGQGSAIVTSANASANGLGVDGATPAVWTEAGWKTKATDAIRRWFDATWDSTAKVTDADITAATEAWGRRQRQARQIERSLTPNFLNYKPGENDFPLINWNMIDPQAEVWWENNEEVVATAPPGQANAFAMAIKEGGRILDTGRPRLFVSGPMGCNVSTFS